MVVDSQAVGIAVLSAPGTLVGAVFDFSVQFELGRDGVRLVGFVEMENDHRGLMKELRVQSPFARDAEEEVRRLLNDRSRGESLSDLYQRFGERAGNQLEGLGYQGAFGVDALVARLSDGELKIRPVVELNPRCTMGRVALELSQLAAPGSCGRLRFFSKRDLGEKGCKDFGELGEKLDEEHPLVWKDVSPRRLASGWVPLNDPEKAKVSLGAFLVG